MMHYDKKISCALGILLVGIVTALFFRHEKTEATEVPALANPQSLDAKIARKPVRPYEAPSRLAGVIEEAEAPSAKRQYDELPDSPPEQLASNATNASSPKPPKPIVTNGNSSSGISGAVLAGHNSEWTAIARNTTRPASKRDENQRTYTVRSGDTLSGIAYRFLGSSARFNEIYEANRVLLRTPNDLRPGMTLRIPPKRRGTNAVVVKSSRQTEPTSTSNAENRKTLSSSPPANSQPAAAKGSDKNKKSGSSAERSRLGSDSNGPVKRFIPIRSSPFRRRGFTSSPPAKRTDKSAQPTTRRALSQTPPKQVPVVDDGAWKNRVTQPKKTETASISDQPGAKPVEYVVQPGDSLERIAVKYYGRRSAVAKILNANRGRLRNANVLRPGTRLTLPRP